jgi:hypothetical protein
MDDKFKKAPRRKKEAVKRVVLSPDAKARYEELARERDTQQRLYGAHLPSEKQK